MAFPVLLDTCVLYPATLCDLLLRVAETGVFRPHWSQDILDELTRNLAMLPRVGPAGAERRVAAMTNAFAEASVAGYEPMIAGMTCDPKDRHVLAAAAYSGCQLIVTFNLRDFPAESLTPHHLGVVGPDDFLLDQLDLYPALVLRALLTQSTDSRRPRLTPLGLLGSLERCGVPRFAAEVRRKADISTWKAVDP